MSKTTLKRFLEATGAEWSITLHLARAASERKLGGVSQPSGRDARRLHLEAVERAAVRLQTGLALVSGGQS